MKIRIAKGGDIFVTAGTIHTQTEIWDLYLWYDIKDAAWHPQTKITLEA